MSERKQMDTAGRNNTHPWQALDRSYKGKFPFRISTTSYIYPDNIIPNVRMLSTCLDEIELVLFESSHEDNLPTENDITCLNEIGTKQGLRYNIHLPVDIYLGDRDPLTRNHAVATIKKIINLTCPLNPTTYTLHFSLRDKTGQDAEDKGRWKNAISNSMENLLKMDISPACISIETLDYPFTLISDIVESFGLSICLDIGHLILYGYPVEIYAEKFLDKTTIIHLHGVRDKKDHIALNNLTPEQQLKIASVITGFKGTVSLEVFSFKDLYNSLHCLENLFPIQNQQAIKKLRQGRYHMGLSSPKKGTVSQKNMQCLSDCRNNKTQKDCK